MDNYITYFQSVMTMGILSEAGDAEEASRLASIKFRDQGELNYCYFDQTDFNPVGTEKWESPLKRSTEKTEDSEEDGMKFVFNPSDEIKAVIAIRLHKPVADLTDEDLASFVQESLNLSLEI